MPRAVKLPSDRSVGFLFTVVFALVAAWLFWTNRMGVIPLALLSAATLLVALVQPSLLNPLNRAWMKFGGLLHALMSPLILGAIYFVVITPVGIAMRLFGRDALRRRLDRAAPSYWIEREPPGPSPDSLPHQF